MSRTNERKAEPRTVSRRDRERRAHRLLLAACALFALASLTLVPLGLRLGWDEIVYASRFGPFAPDGPGVPFSAPRTRGVPLLLAPVAAWSDSVVLLRAWLTLLATAALYLGFRPWLRAVPRAPEAAAVAAGLYGGLWIALFYASAAMPNHYTAMGAAAAVGLFVRARPGPRACLGVGAGVAVATLMRPNDGGAVALPLLLAAALVPAWRSWGRALAVLGGVGAGFVPWAVEAYARFGGVRERLDEASAVQGGLRLTDSALHQFTTIDGPLLCRPCAGDGVRPFALEWWLLLAVLVPVGLWSARGARRTAAAGLLAVATAVAAALPYVLFVPYAAPRFLLPAHALLAVPAALGVLAVARWARGAQRAQGAQEVQRAQGVREVRRAAGLGARLPALTGGLLGLALFGHLLAQVVLTAGSARVQGSAREDWERVADVLRAHGVRAPCLLRASASEIPLAYVAGCEPAGREAGRRPTALVLREAPPPPWARAWRHVRVPDTYAPDWNVYVRPTPTPLTGMRNHPSGSRS
ncbi:hypothetical protein [Streptomyces sp. G45]|uniref:hypothetical protein n=1 Tax=Streptomyces sp. G45 TaxID=3406627 RepID=UPI003C1E4ECF